MTETFNFKTDATTLYKDFKAVSFAMSREEVRYYLRGAALDFDGKTLKLTATDGDRLHSITLDWERPENLKPFQYIIPDTFVNDITRRKPGKNDDSDTFVVISPENITITNKGNVQTSPYVDGNYPNYMRIIPEKDDSLYTIRINTKYLAEIGKAVALMEDNGIENATLQLPVDNKSPIRITDGKGNVYVLMPMKI